MNEPPTLAVIGGSGLYAMPGLEDMREQTPDTPFGQPSAPIVIGTLAGARVAFLARHGIGHRLSPSEINYRANIYALKMLGVTRVVSVSACGSLREDYAPGHMVIPDQLFDFTKHRPRTFFENGLVAHVGVADPFCPHLSRQVFQAARAAGAGVHRGAAFITIEGPRFSTRAESHTFRGWGMDLIGMTTCPEAFLAREAELCYTVIAHVTDYDVWHTTEEPVSAEMVFKVIRQNLETAQATIRHLAAHLAAERDCDCEHALASAITTAPAAIAPEARQKLALLVEKYLTQPERP